MGAMLTVVTERDDQKGRRMYTIDGSTTARPRLLLQKRKEAGTEGVASDNISVIYGTEDANGVMLESKVVFEASVRRPNNGLVADVTAAKAVFLDIVNSDEFAQTITSQDYLK